VGQVHEVLACDTGYAVAGQTSRSWYVPSPVSSHSLLMSVAASWYREYLAGTGHAPPRGLSAVSTDPRSTIEVDLEMWRPVLERFHLAHAESHSPGATHAPQRSGGRDDRTILCL